MISSTDIQQEFASHMRHPDINPAPADIEPRRLKIYRDLIYNNIEGFIANGFPVLRKLYTADRWHRMVRDFVCRHQSSSPYFLELGREFVDYLNHEHQPDKDDPAFLVELAMYEWAELALFVAEGELPKHDKRVDPDLLDAIPSVSPLAWSMIFRYPVHLIGPSFQPDEPSVDPVCLVVYRNRDDEVKFLESNPVTSRLLELCEGNCQYSARQLLLQIAGEMGSSDSGAIVQSGEAILAQLRNLDIIMFNRPGS